MYRFPHFSMRVIVTCQIIMVELVVSDWCDVWHVVWWSCFSAELLTGVTGFFWIHLVIWFPRYPGTGEYDKFFEEGIYKCAGCGTPLYKSSTKFNSGCGWPAFYEGLPGAIRQTVCTISLLHIRIRNNLCSLASSAISSINECFFFCWTLAGPWWEADRDHMYCLWRTLGAHIQRGGV
jgi:hypothetical protein